MKITITQQDDGTFIADRPELPGSPAIGRGRTWKEAIGDLVIKDERDFCIECVYVENKQGEPFKFRPKQHR